MSFSSFNRSITGVPGRLGKILDEATQFFSVMVDGTQPAELP
jgi:hypothetical protein